VRSLLFILYSNISPVAASFSKGLRALCLGLVFFSCNVFAGSPPLIEQQLQRWVDHGSVMLNDENGKTLLSFQTDKQLIPASIIKIYTGLAALHLLGESYRFKTEFYLDPEGNLAIKGWGDPQLISEEIHLIAVKLKAMGVERVRQIWLDQTAFTGQVTIDGKSNSLNPYDAVNSALVVNFNTLFLGRDRHGVVFSAEPVTPLTPLAKRLGRQIKPGTQDRFNLSTQPENALRYAGELFREILKQHGMPVKYADIRQTVINEHWVLAYTHQNSSSLKMLLSGLLKYSNNFIANQIYLVVGAENKGYPATLAKAHSTFETLFREKFPEHTGQTIIDEASGISRKNRLSAKAMMAVLEQFRPHAELLDWKKGVLLKSGTLTGVYNYAGYLKTASGYRPFVILLNQKKNQRDKILKLLLQYNHRS
jgi:D-alanyl-D-alanine carboxypeptidase/D-alanyl-D-alanine-endopeptidase (penicillin-binding protein 4)